MIVDASVVLRAFFPDEDQAQALIREHVIGQVALAAPSRRRANQERSHFL